jgi:signal transduction histidine kinase
MTIPTVMNDQRSLSLSEMAAALAHEVRNPLALAMVNINILELGCTNFDDKIRFGAVKRELAKIAELMMELTNLDIKRNKDEKTEARELLEEIVSAYAAAYSADMDFILNARHDAVVTIPQNHLRIILNNLIKNAVEAVNEGEAERGRVEINLTSDKNGTTISVSDNGIGMDGAAIEKAMEPRYTTKETGSGIGLYAANALAAQYGGKLKASGELGRGCVFELSFR